MASEDREDMERSEEGVPEAIVRTRAGPSIVWLIPLIAAVVGLYLAYSTWSEQGPSVTIEFQTAEGLVAGQTRLKFKNVDVGVVESVELNKDLSRVHVQASMVKELSHYMTDQTQFWVVRAKVSAAEISGVDTLLSGAYIGVDPSDKGKRTREFKGLEEAPVVRSDKPGTLFDLRARQLGSVDVGSPVYFRWLKVGQIAGYSLDESGNTVNVKIFIESPHDKRVRTTTRFWNASGFDAVLSAEGLQIDSPSVMSMLVGGVAFETPATVAVAMDVPEGMVFELYPNKQATRQPRYSQQSRYLLYFDGSVSGLVPGSPVEFRGIKVGEVLSVDIHFDAQTNEVQIPVVIEIEPERLGITQKKLYKKDVPRIASLVGRGLRARLATNNVLTGKKAISFEFIPDAEPVTIIFGEAYPILPTVSGGLDAITQRVARILDRVENLPIESIGNNLNEVFANLSQTLHSVDSLTDSANANLLPQLTASLVKLEETLASADAMIAPDSAMAMQLESMMSDLAGAAQSLKLLAQRLEEHPEELLRGKGE